MELSIHSLLANFAEDKLVAPKALEKKLGCEDSASIHRLQIALDALEKIGILAKERGKYRRVAESELVEGKLRCSSKGFCFAIQDQEGSEDIYIRESQLSNAWNGDRVLVKVTKEGRRRRSPEGEVRLILERSNPSVIAKVKQTEQGIRGVPLDDRLLFELDLQPNQTVSDPATAVDQLAHVQVVRYPLGQYPPLGTITQILGDDAQSAADTELVCCKYGFPRQFSEAALGQALPGKLKKADLKNRLDQRSHLTVTLGATALADTAISLESAGSDNWLLGVHIADVSHCISPDTPLDQEAYKRGLAVYLGEIALPLLPETLVAASFVPGEERFAISLLLTINPEGEVLEYEIQPSVIQVDHALTAEQVAADLPAKSALGSWLQQAQTLSQALRQQRHQRGSFDLNLAQNSLTCYSDEGLSKAIAIDSANPTRSMLSEFALLANQTLLSHLQALNVQAIYRVQSPPDALDVQELIKLATNLGIALSLANEDAVQPQDYQNFAAQLLESDLAPVLTELLLDTLRPATYSAVAGPHFSLAAVMGYGSIVSPLSRYADLLNQRVLQAIFADGRDRRTSRAKEKVNLRHSSCLGQVSWNVLPPDSQRDLEAAIAAAIPHLNEKERIAQQAIKDLEGLQKVKQMQQRTGEVFAGLITGIQSYGFFVEIAELIVEGLVHVSSLKDDWYEYRSRQQTLIGRKNRRQYRLGDRVEVQVKSVDYYRQQIDLLVVGGGSEASEEDLVEGTDANPESADPEI